MKTYRYQRNLRLLSWGLLALCLGPLGMAGCIIPKPDITLPKEPVVTVAEVTTKTIPRRFSFTGTLQAVKSVGIMSRVTGYLQSRDFVEGDIVKKDQLLYQIDPRPFQAQLDGAIASKAQNEAALEYWNIEVTRYTTLAKQGAGSVERKQSSVAKVAELKAAIQRDDANIVAAKLDLGYTRILAPFDARIQSTEINVGALVTENKDVLTTAIQVDPIYVLFNISRNQLSQIQALDLQTADESDPSWLENSQVTLILPDGKPYAEVGKVDYVSAQIDTNTDMLEFRAIFKNTFQGADEVELLPGQYCPLTLDLGELKDALLIPQSALVQGQEGAQVYVLGSDNTVQPQNVVVGSDYEDSFVVLKGLKEGETIITEGVQKVQPGMKVKPQKAGSQKSSDTEAATEKTPPKK
ncbi:MAG: efflux RND transporter periplasmic adaptor subunit [Mariniblastus sp.]|nr:efflux RND transporter periplasmic adaptor subunit [Mariniblastus sp.]